MHSSAGDLTMLFLVAPCDQSHLWNTAVEPHGLLCFAPLISPTTYRTAPAEVWPGVWLSQWRPIYFLNLIIEVRFLKHSCTGSWKKLVTISKVSHNHSYAIKINENSYNEKCQRDQVCRAIVRWVWFPLLPRVRSEGKTSRLISNYMDLEFVFEFTALAVVSS